MLIGATPDLVRNDVFRRLMDMYVHLGALLIPYIEATQFTGYYFNPATQARMTRDEWELLMLPDYSLPAGLRILGAKWFFEAPSAGANVKVPAVAPEAFVTRKLPDGSYQENYQRTFAEYLSIIPGANGTSLYTMEVLSWDSENNVPTVISYDHREYLPGRKKYGGMKWDTIALFMNWCAARGYQTKCLQEAHSWMSENIEVPV